jgi:murein DD-endopeptidase MepM/ murein hydrolase activator NlpD
LFQPRDSEGTAQGVARDGAPLLSHAQILPGAARAYLPSRLTRRHALGDRLIALRDRLDLVLARVDFAPDLASDIGSLRWFRGLATLFGLSGLALLAWPDLGTIEATPPMALDQTARDEFRSQMIMPLGLGADSGRRMAATAAVIPLRSAPERPRIDLVATLAQGDSFARMLQRAGVGSDEARHLSDLVARSMPLAEIRPGTKVDIVLGRRPSSRAARPLETLSFRARFDLELGVERRGGVLTLDPRPIQVDSTPLRIRAPVGGSLYRSARAAGAPATAVQKYLRTLGQYVDLDSGLGAQDEFDIIVAYKRAATGEAEVGDLLYAGVIRGGKPRTQLMRWGKDGRFYEASGVGEQRSGLMAPVPGAVISRYGMRRHPILGYMRMHRGLDFRGGHGTPIHAVTDGTVQFAGRHGGHGNFVRLSHGGGLATGYAHMSRIAVNSGQHVRRGQVIGYVGSTGLSTGPHLHYEMYRNGQPVDPASVRFVTRAELSGAELQAFRARLAALQQVEPGAALAALRAERPAAAEPQREIDRVDQPKQIR